MNRGPSYVNNIPQLSEACFEKGDQCILEELSPKKLELHVLMMNYQVRKLIRSLN